MAIFSATLLEPKEIEIDGQIFILSKFPALAGREIMARYPSSLAHNFIAPKLADYSVNEEAVLKLMSYVAVPRQVGEEPQRLNSRALIENHCIAKGWETLAKIEKAMLEYNCSFLTDGRAVKTLDGLSQNIPQLVSKLLTPLLDRFLTPEKSATTSSNTM